MVEGHYDGEDTHVSNKVEVSIEDDIHCYAQALWRRRYWSCRAGSAGSSMTSSTREAACPSRSPWELTTSISSSVGLPFLQYADAAQVSGVLIS